MKGGREIRKKRKRKEEKNYRQLENFRQAIRV